MFLVLVTSSSLLLVWSTAALGQKPTRATLTPREGRQVAPQFRLANTSGQSVRLSDFRGKPVVVNLWATTCGGCRAELPSFVQLDRTYRTQGVSVVGISFDIMYEDLKSTAEAWDRVKPFVREHGMAYEILLDDGSVERAYKVTALPATYLIDRSGRIAATYIGVVDSSNLEANVKTLLGERP